MSQLFLAAEAARIGSAKSNPLTVADTTPVETARVAETAIAALTKYIPTEVITLYVASIAALPAIQSDYPSVTATPIYFGFAVLTPILFVLIFHNQLALNEKPYPSIWNWPWWRIFASTIAFCVWALAVPNNPFIATKSAGVLAGIGAALISTLLSLIAPIVERR